MNACTWDIEVILRDARKHPEIDEELYAKQILKQCDPDTIGLILRAEHFAEWVKDGFITSYDGHGYYLNPDFTDAGYVDINAKKILAKAKDFPYVRWCNK